MGKKSEKKAKKIKTKTKTKEMTRENAKRIEKKFNNLEDCVKKLLEYQKSGISVVVDYDGCLLYSCDVTMDNAFKEVCGKTKEEYDNKIKRMEKGILSDCGEKFEDKKDRNRIKTEHLPKWIEQGKKFVCPQKMEEWRECAQIIAEDGGSSWFTMGQAVVIMTNLENGAELETQTNRMCHCCNDKESRLLQNIVANFSSRGPDFYDAIFGGESQYTINIRDENRKMERDPRWIRRQEEKELENLKRDLTMLKTRIEVYEEQSKELKAKIEKAKTEHRSKYERKKELEEQLQQK